MGMIDLIKKTAISAVESRNPVNLLFGTVVNPNPIEIQIHQKLTLTKEFLIVTETAFQKGLIEGDRIVLLRMQGGHQFLVLDKVVEL
jgi:hypothetical protein